MRPVSDLHLYTKVPFFRTPAPGSQLVPPLLIPTTNSGTKLNSMYTEYYDYYFTMLITQRETILASS